MTIYIDEIFVMNLLMDGIVLWAVAKLVQRPIIIWRLIAAAIAGALYSVLIFLPDCIWLANGAVKGVCAFLMAFIAFGWVRWQAFIKTVLYLYLVSFVMGGSTIALMYFWGERIVQTWNGVALVQVDFNILWLFGGTILALMLVHLLRKSFQRKMEQSLEVVPVTVFLRGRSVKLQLMLDSGNCLKDPVNDMPVIVVELRYVRSLFSEEELRYLSTGSADAVLYVPTLSDRIRLLPYQTVGYRGLMLGVRLDSILIHSGDISSQQKPLSNVVMALNAQQFGAEGTYQGIISPLFV